MLIDALVESDEWLRMRYYCRVVEFGGGGRLRVVIVRKLGVRGNWAKSLNNCC